MTLTSEEIEAETARRKAEYGSLFEKIAEVLFRLDPIGINFDENTDEYYPETLTILPRLGSCNSADDVVTVVHEEFERWFDADTAGAKEDYRQIADEIWRLWQNREGLAGNSQAI